MKIYILNIVSGDRWDGNTYIDTTTYHSSLDKAKSAWESVKDEVTSKVDNHQDYFIVSVKTIELDTQKVIQLDILHKSYSEDYAKYCDEIHERYSDDS